jgi:hypothetical protein
MAPLIQPVYSLLAVDFRRIVEVFEIVLCLSINLKHKIKIYANSSEHENCIPVTLPYSDLEIA